MNRQKDFQAKGIMRVRVKEVEKHNRNVSSHQRASMWLREEGIHGKGGGKRKTCVSSAEGLFCWEVSTWRGSREEE